MKKFVVFLIIVGGLGAAGYFFYDPYLKPHLEPLLAKFAKAGPEPVETPAPEPQPPAPTPGGGERSPAPTPDPTPTPDPVASNAPPPPAGIGPEPPADNEIDRLLQQKYPLPQVLPLMQIVDNWNNVPANAFPTEVALKERVAFTLNGPDGKPIGASVAVPGTLVQPARLNGAELTIVSLANRAMRETVNVDATDFKDRIQKRYLDFVATQLDRVKAQRDKARKILMEEPEMMASASQTTWDSDDDPRFNPVKASLAQNALPSVKLEEATGFRWGGSRKIRGKHAGTYDTVVVSFDVKTIFGVFPTEWMALLDNGRVIAWVDPITHETSAM